MICIVLWLFFLGAYAQSDSLYIDTVYIQSSTFSSSHKVLLKDNAPINNLAQSIQQSEAVYVKNYGGLSLATLSIRGSSSSQTGIYWNNLSINNSMLGLLDLSIIPSSFMEKSALVYGSESTTYGSGNIGGGLYMTNEANKSIRLSSSMGSFGNYNSSAQVGFGNKLVSSIKVQYQSIQNDYPYTLSNGDVYTLENGSGSQFNAMYNSAISIGKNDLSFNYWHTSANRNIPYTTRQSSGNDSTKDFNDRFNLNLNRNIYGGFFEWNAGYFINNNQFFQTELINENINHTLSNRVTYKVIRTNFSYTIGLDESYLTGQSRNYAQKETQHRIAAFTNFSHRNKYLDFDIRLRQELINSSLVPFIPEISISKKGGLIQTALKLNRVYRNPTLNDLFWAPGGNSDLLAEDGWGGEIHTEFSYKKGKFNLVTSLTGYTRSVDNWIIWTLISGSSFFSPRNINKVWSRGVEYSFSSKVRLNNQLELSNSFNYNLNLSTFQEAQEFPRKEIGDQLLYTPVHQLNNNFSLVRGKFEGRFITRYFSSSNGINAELEPYITGDLHLTYKHLIENHRINIQFQVNNIWNESYRIIEFRPMAGRNFLLNITYKLN